MLIHKLCKAPVTIDDSKVFGVISEATGETELMGIFCPICEIELLDDSEMEEVDGGKAFDDLVA